MPSKLPEYNWEVWGEDKEAHTAQVGKPSTRDWEEAIGTKMAKVKKRLSFCFIIGRINRLVYFSPGRLSFLRQHKCEKVEINIIKTYKKGYNARY